MTSRPGDNKDVDMCTMFVKPDQYVKIIEYW